MAGTTTESRQIWHIYRSAFNDILFLLAKSMRGAVVFMDAESLLTELLSPEIVCRALLDVVSSRRAYGTVFGASTVRRSLIDDPR